MPRNAIYLLLTKTGPSEDEQLAFIQRKVGIGQDDQTYVDDVSASGMKRVAFPDRDNMMRQLRAGDRVVVATPGRLGVGREDVRSVLHDLHRKGVPLVDASTGRELIWTDEVADALQFFERAAMEHKRNAAQGARNALKNMGYEPAIVSKRKAWKLPEDEARVMWLDRIRYPAGEDVAKACGVTLKTMYNYFGKRVLEPTPKKLPPTMRLPAGRNYVYVMLRRDGLHKIGFSLDPLARKRQLEMQLKQPMKLVHWVIRPGDGHALESVAHGYLANHRVEGEWFDLALDQIMQGIETASRHLDVSNYQKRRRAIVDAAEKKAKRSFSRAEITALLKTMEIRDETAIES